MAYVPSSLVLKEGSYEGESHTVYGLPSKWQVGIETRILNEVIKLSEKNGLIKNK
jgi:hypothetical protein